MQQNILRNSGITNIYLIYQVGSNKFKCSVKLRYMDNESSYFAADLPENFCKPSNNTNAQIVVYTTDGLYKNNTVITNTTANLKEVVFEVAIPKSWEFEQMRQSSRIVIALPVKLKTSNDVEIAAVTHDISTGGVSFYSKEIIDESDTKADITIQIPNDIVMSTPNRELIFESELIRKTSSKENSVKNLYAYKFININPEYQLALRNILMSINS